MTADCVQTYKLFLRKLQKEPDELPATLNDIKRWIISNPDTEARQILRSVGISKIIQCLNETEYKKSSAQSELVCEVLSLCFDKFDTGETLKFFTSYIMYLLRHEKDCVRRLAIEEVYKTLSLDVGLLPAQYVDVYVAVAQLVTDKDICVANKAIIITSKLPMEAYPKVLDEMKIALQCDSSSKCNALEVIVKISERSQDLFHLSAQYGYIDFMLDELNSNDILYQPNILQFLSRLAIKPYGLNYLVKQGALNKIVQHVENLNTNPLATLLIPGYMRFFGCIAHRYPKEVFEKYPVLLDMLFQALNSDDASNIPVALETLGFIGSTVEGKMCLIAVGAKYIMALDKVTSIIINSPIELKVRALYCFANLISIKKESRPSNEPVDHRVTLMTREWFRSLCERPTEKLFELCKNPFTDICDAAFVLLDAVCDHQWGQELVHQVAGFIEYLLDRTVDYSKRCNEVKYNVIKKLSQSSAVDPNILSRLQKYVDQGPFYAETKMQVAMEEGN